MFIVQTDCHSLVVVESLSHTIYVNVSVVTLFGVIIAGFSISIFSSTELNKKTNIG